MHHLQIRVLFEKSPRAALNSISKMLEELEALVLMLQVHKWALLICQRYQHVAWIYAFRFLRTSLLLKLGSHGDILSAVQNLRAISTLAEGKRDHAIYMTAMAFEALVHLRSAGVDSVTQAQHAIASARKMQLEDVINDIPQLVLLLHYLDLACSLRHGQHEPARAKMQAVQIYLDGMGKQHESKADDFFLVPIRSGSAANLTKSTGGIFHKDSEGRDLLSITWLSLEDLYIMAYFISGVTAFLRSQSDPIAERFINESLRMHQGTTHFLVTIKY